MSNPPEFASIEDAKRFLANMQQRVKTLEERDEQRGTASNVDNFASKEDVQRAVVAAVQQVVEERDKKAAEERMARRFHDNEWGLREFTRTAPDGTAQVRMVGGVNPDTNCYEEGLLDSREVHGEWHRDFREAVSDLNFVRMFKSNPAKGVMPQHVRSHVAAKRVQRLMERAPDDYRRIFADSAGQGAEWIPAPTLPRYERDLELNRRLEAIFPTLPLTSSSQTLPYLSQGLQPFLKGAPTVDKPPAHTASTPTTAERTFAPVGFAVLVQIEEDASEDAILASEPIMRSEAVRASVDGMEDAIINADTGTHGDTGIASWDGEGRWGETGSAADHRYAWVGLRHRALDISCATDQSAAETAAGALVGRGNLAAGYAAANDLVWIPSPFYYVKKMLGFTEVETLDQYGPGATILTGEVARLYGSPIIPSQFMGNQYNASGVFDNSTKTKGGLLCVNRSRFVVGVRRQGAIEAWKDVRNGVTYVVFTTRKDFRTIDSATKKNVHLAYNLTATS